MKLRSIKKKTRGLRRKVKRIDKWKAENILLDLESLRIYGKSYVKLWIPPFYNLYNINKNEIGHKNPPSWYNKIILRAMIDVYESWEQSLKDLGEPYYLKIWLYEPEFIKSQIVAAIGDNIDYYENIFEREEKSRKFSIDKYRLNDKDITKFRCSCYKDQYVQFQSEFEDDEIYLAFLKKKAYRIQEEIILGQKEICYYIKEGNIWVGDIVK